MPDVTAGRRSTATAKPKAKRQALPGGAPLKAAKAPKAARAKKPARPKPACKYGPRDADGYCPKKPPSTRASSKRSRTRVTSRTVEGATGQAIDVIVNPRSTTSQKGAAATQVGTTVLTDAARKAARKRAPEIEKAVRDIAPIIGIVAGSAIILKLGGRALTALRIKQATRFANDELKKTRQRLGKQKLSPADEETLWAQYFDYARKRPVTNPFLGK